MGLGALQPGHLIVILVIVLLIFGPGKLPELGKALGEGMRELKRATTGDEHDPKKGAPDNQAATTAVAAPVAPVAPVASVGSGPAAVAPVTASPPAARTCPSCHGVISVSDKFCGHCGSATESAARIA